MNDDFILLLLQTIRVNGNTMYLLDQGYTLSALNRDIDFLKGKSFIKNNEKQELSLTKEGEVFFQYLNREKGHKGFYKYVSSMVSMKDDPMQLTAVYVPPKRGKGRKK